MKKSYITQKIIAKSFKNLIKKEDYSQISVSDIMKEAQIRRQTFYNYFQSKGELLSWIFEDEFNEIIADNLGYYSWESNLLLLLRYLDSNQGFYKEILLLDEYFDNFFLEQCEKLLEKAIYDQEKKSDYRWSDLEKAFICQYNADALCKVSERAIIRGESLEKLHKTIVRLLTLQLDFYKI